MSIRVLLVDDQELVRTGFRMILADEDGIGWSARRPTGGGRRLGQAPAPRCDRHGHPHAGHGRGRGDPRLAGIDAGSGPRVLVLTTFDGDEHVVEPSRGASGFLLKDVLDRAPDRRRRRAMR